MIVRYAAACLAVALALASPGLARAQEKAATAEDKAATSSQPKGDPADPKAAPKPAKVETATFGGGCFWCTEAVLERIPGVKSVVSGYAGGNVANPTYQMVGAGLTGHAEVVQIDFDPEKVSYDALLKVFFKSHDPTTLNSQGPDFGTQYRSIILYHTEAQKQAAQKLYRELTASKAFREPIVTELVPFTAFYPAEAYHQDYYRNHRYDDYSQMYITPKIKKLKLNK